MTNQSDQSIHLSFPPSSCPRYSDLHRGSSPRLSIYPIHLSGNQSIDPSVPINQPIIISLNVTTNEIAPINRSISQSVNQSTNRLSSCSELSLHPFVNRSIDQSINPSIHQSIRHSIIESLNHSIDQSDRAISRFDQPVQSIAHLSLPSLQLSQVLRPASRF